MPLDLSDLPALGLAALSGAGLLAGLARAIIAARDWLRRRPHGTAEERIAYALRDVLREDRAAMAAEIGREVASQLRRRSTDTTEPTPRRDGGDR